MNRFSAGIALFVSALVLLSGGDAKAGVFNTYHFVSPGEFALGGEVDLALTNGTGAAGNFRFTQGLSELMNVTALIGTGGGAKKFRVGGNLTFDFFPDIEGQPGIGIATQGIYYRLEGTGQLELTGIPYVHKTFVSAGNEIEPFVAIPFGMSFTDGQYRSLSSFVIGSMFKGSEHVRFSMEFGIAINNTQTYMAGGMTYYH